MSARMTMVIALAAAALVACGGDDDGGGTTSSGGSSSGGSSSGSTSSSCSSESTSSNSYVCIGGRCKCTSSKEDSYPYTEKEAESACGSSTSTGNCPPADEG